jgi:molybdenum cofactor biosynthesis enzyme
MTTGDFNHTKSKQEEEGQLTHLDEHRDIYMVDVTERPETTREAIARGRVRIAP